MPNLTDVTLREPILRDVRWPRARRRIAVADVVIWALAAFVVGVALGQNVFAVWWPH